MRTEKFEMLLELDFMHKQSWYRWLIILFKLWFLYGFLWKICTLIHYKHLLIGFAMQEFDSSLKHHITYLTIFWKQIPQTYSGLPVIKSLFEKAFSNKSNCWSVPLLQAPVRSSWCRRPDSFSLELVLANSPLKSDWSISWRRNSAHTDQTAPLEIVWSLSALFAQISQWPGLLRSIGTSPCCLPKSSKRNNFCDFLFASQKTDPFQNGGCS